MVLNKPRRRQEERHRFRPIFAKPRLGRIIPLYNEGYITRHLLGVSFDKLFPFRNEANIGNDFFQRIRGRHFGRLQALKGWVSRVRPLVEDEPRAVWVFQRLGTIPCATLEETDGFSGVIILAAGAVPAML